LKKTFKLGIGMSRGLPYRIIITSWRSLPAKQNVKFCSLAGNSPFDIWPLSGDNKSLLLLVWHVLFWLSINCALQNPPTHWANEHTLEHADPKPNKIIKNPWQVSPTHPPLHTCSPSAWIISKFKFRKIRNSKSQGPVVATAAAQLLLCGMQLNAHASCCHPTSPSKPTHIFGYQISAHVQACPLLHSKRWWWQGPVTVTAPQKGE